MCGFKSTKGKRLQPLPKLDYCHFVFRLGIILMSLISVSRDLVHRQTAMSAIGHLALGVYGFGCEDSLTHLLNYVWPNIFETSPHVVQAFMHAVEGIRVGTGSAKILQYVLQVSALGTVGCRPLGTLCLFDIFICCIKYSIIYNLWKMFSFRASCYFKQVTWLFQGLTLTYFETCSVRQVRVIFTCPK